MITEIATTRREFSMYRRFLPAVFSLCAVFPLAVLLWAGQAGACWMEFKVTGGEREIYAPGDTVTVGLTLMLTHGECLLELSDTEFTGEGIEILGATTWKKVKEKPVIVEKKLRIVIKGDGKDGDVAIRARRRCERQGGDISMILIPGMKKIGKGKE